MLTIEEYIAKRKKEDDLNEFDCVKRIENIRACTNYIFEYFDSYLDISKVDDKTILNNARLDKYRNQVKEYAKNVQDWLVNLYDEHGKYMHKNISNILDEDDVFLLYSSDIEFRSISYYCYSRLIKKYPFLKDETEMLFLFITDYHKVKSNTSMQYEKIPFFCKSINNWIDQTQKKYNVNIPGFVCAYIHKFSDAVDNWPIAHKKKRDNPYMPYHYDYKQKKNLFNIDSIYTKVSKKSFIKGRKQGLELLMMYYWIHDIETDDEYWNEYSSKVIAQLNK